MGGRKNIQLRKNTTVTKLRISSFGIEDRDDRREETAAGRNSRNSSNCFRGASLGLALIAYTHSLRQPPARPRTSV